MEVIDFVKSKLNFAILVLDDFIIRYGEMGDDERLEKSDTIFDNVRTYLRVEENMLLPALRRQETLYQDIIEEVHLVHEQINYVLEHTIMIHVDEPQHEYYNRMVQLRALLGKATELDHTRLFPWLDQYLDATERSQMGSKLDVQTTHESMPPSGSTLY